MKDLVNFSGKKEVYTSLQIAEWTNKEHKHVIRDIEDEMEKLEDLGKSIFGLSSYKLDTNTKPYKMYKMTKDGLMQIATRYDAKVRFKLIQKVKELEENKPSYQIEDEEERARRWLEELKEKKLLLENNKKLEEKKNQLEEKIKEDEPKVIFAGVIGGSEDCVSVGVLAKMITKAGYKIGRNTLFEELREEGYLIKQKGDDFNVPTQYSIERGWFTVVENTVCRSNGIQIKKTPKVRGKGQQYFIDKYTKKKGVI